MQPQKKQSKCYTVFYSVVLVMLTAFISIRQSDVFIISGKVMHKDAGVESATINLYKDNFLVLKKLSKIYGAFQLSLDANTEYTIEIIKQGLVTQKIAISTQLDGYPPNDITKTTLTHTAVLIEYMEGLDISLFEKPIAKYAFDKNKGMLTEDMNYKNSTARKLKAVKEQLNELKAKAYQDDIEASKELARKGDIKEAFESYRESYYKYYKDEEVMKKKPGEDTGIHTNEPYDMMRGSTKDQTEESIEKASRDTAPSIREMEAKLEKIEAIGNEKEIANMLSQIAQKYYEEEKLGKAITYYNRSLELEEKEDDKEAMAKLQSEIALVYYDSGKFNNTIIYFEQSLNNKQLIDDKEGMAATLSDIATVYENTFQYEEAIEYYEKAIEITTNLDDKTETSILFNDIGNVYYEQSDFHKSIEYFEKSLEINNELNNEEEISNSLNNIGVVYYDIGDYDKANTYFENAYKKAENQGNKEGMATVLNNIGNINYDWEKYKNALNYYEQSYDLRQEMGSENGMAASLHNIGNVYIKLGKINKAIEAYLKSSVHAKNIHSNLILSKNYRALYKAYQSLNNCQKALAYSVLYNETGFAGMDDDMHEQIADMTGVGTEKDLRISRLKRELRKQKLLAQYESNRRKKEVMIKDLQIKKNEAIAKKRKFVAYASCGGLLGVLVFSFFLFREYKQKKKANTLLIDKNKQITAQQKNITDSIKYASRIQNAVLPRPSIMNAILPEHFILFKPRDIVSGDFYWMTQKEGKTVIAAADCTGHGVPGAFMSMLGFAFLNEIVNRSSVQSAGTILSELRDMVIKSLHQTGESMEESKDGMDMVLCIIDFKKNEMQYAGAFNPLYIINKAELRVIKGDKMPISIHDKADTPFTTHKIKLTRGDILYMFSDGYADQFGGPEFKKFMIKRFQNLLLEIHTQSMAKQKDILDKKIEEWRGNIHQMDDILVMGVKV